MSSNDTYPSSSPSSADDNNKSHQNRTSPSSSSPIILPRNDTKSLTSNAVYRDAQCYNDVTNTTSTFSPLRPATLDATSHNEPKNDEDELLQQERDDDNNKESQTSSSSSSSSSSSTSSSSLTALEAKTSLLRLEQKQLELELLEIYEERQRIVKENETILESMQENLQSLFQAKCSLQKYCNHMEDSIRDHRIQSNNEIAWTSTSHVQSLRE